MNEQVFDGTGRLKITIPVISTSIKGHIVNVPAGTIVNYNKGYGDYIYICGNFNGENFTKMTTINNIKML